MHNSGAKIFRRLRPGYCHNGSEILQAKSIPFRSLRVVDETSVPAHRRGVDRDRMFEAKTVEVMRPARFGPRARQIEPAEGLRANDGPDHIAIDVAIASQPPA